MSDRSPSVRRLVLGAAGGLGLGALARWGLPLDPVPGPSGPHPVGTRWARVDAPRRGADAALPVRLWYPAAGSPTSNARPSPLLRDASKFARAVGVAYGVPPVALTHLRWVHVPAALDAPADAGAVRGVAVLVHGWKGFGAIHADLAVELASEGWLVAAADHVGGALAAQFPDGSTVPLDRDLLPPEGDPAYWPRARALVETYAGDLLDVLDGLAAVVQGMKGLAQVTVVAHSTGGGAAIVAGADPRVAKLVAMDPWVEPVPEAGRDLRAPLVALRCAAWVGNRNDQILGEIPGVELTALPGTVHADFTILGCLSPLTRAVGMTRANPLVARRAVLRAVRS